jgi:hypothetical protein
MNKQEEFVPWIIVFMVLSAIILCMSSLTTFFSSLKKKVGRLNLVASEDGEDDIGLAQSLRDQGSKKLLGTKKRALWMSKETMRPIDYVYSESQLTR